MAFGNNLIKSVIIFGFMISITECQPAMTWPLGNTSYASEITEQQTPSSLNDQCGFNFEGSFPPLPYTPLKLENDGYVDLHVEFAVASQTVIDDIAFSVFVNPSVTADGCLLHYIYNGTPAVGYIKEFKFFLSSGNIWMTFIDYLGNDAGTLSLNTFILSPGVWYLVQLGHDQSNGKLILSAKTANIASDDSQTVEYTFPTSLSLKMPGTLRIGKSFDNSLSTFSGGITCVTMYDKKDIADEANLILACSQPFAQVTGNPAGECNGGTFKSNSAYFRLYGRNILPGGAVTLLSTLTSCGKVLDCGSYCMKHGSCISFAVENNPALCKICKLYKHNYYSQVSHTGMDYYIRQ